MATIARTQRNGREVLDTGRVCIGLLYEPKPQREPGVHAEFVQRVLTASEPPREWVPCPKEFHVSPSLIQRLRDFFNR